MCLQIAMLSPCEAVTQNFREKYQALAGALDATRHELPVRGIHLRSDGSGLLGRTQLLWSLMRCPSSHWFCRESRP